MKTVMSMVDRLCEQRNGLQTLPSTIMTTSMIDGGGDAQSTTTRTQTTSNLVPITTTRVMSQNILGIAEFF